MNKEQKIIAVSIQRGVQAQFLADTLNTLAADGWRVEQISTLLTRKGGAIYVLKDAYYSDIYYLVLEKSKTKVAYRCMLKQREKVMNNDVDKLNTLLDEQARDGYHLAHILHGTIISTNVERPTIGTVAHILLFEKEEE